MERKPQPSKKTFTKMYTHFGQKLGSTLCAPSETELRIILLLFGVTLIVVGWQNNALCQTTYNDERLRNSVNAILLYIEGSFGALVMVCAGLGAIISSAFGQYRASLGLLVVSVGAFILRSVLSTFFNDQGIRG